MEILRERMRYLTTVKATLPFCPMIVLLGGICCLLGCRERDGGGSAVVTLEAFQEPYVSTGTTGTSPVAYRTVVTVVNSGSTPIVFDTIVCVFVASTGKPLTNKTYVFDKTKGYSQDGYSGDLLTATIHAGAVEAFEASTDGYTFDLLQNAGGLPLKFLFTLIVGPGTPAPIVVGPYEADLPGIEELPVYGKAQGKALPMILRSGSGE